MARIDDITNRSAVLATAYGVHAAQGNLILHETNPITGGQTRVTVLQALGEGEWDSLLQCFYGGHALSLSDYHFHPGSLSTGKADPKQGVDSFFPGGITYNATAYAAARLPEGVGTDASPNEFKTVARCLKVQNYDATGAPIKADGSYGIELQYSANPALVVADLVLNRRMLRRRQKFAGSIDTAADTLTTSKAHGLLTNWVVQVRALSGGTLPAPLAAATDYFVERVSANVIKLYDGPVGAGGTLVNLTTAGSGSGSFQIIDASSRVDWASWAALRDYSDEVLSWVPGVGLVAEFFSDAALTTPIGKRVDPHIDWNWDNQSPGFGHTSNTFSVRWSGKIKAKFSETYTFTATVRHGCRLYVNNTAVIDSWTSGDWRQVTGTFAFTAGTEYDFRFEFYKEDAYGGAALRWQSASVTKDIVPSSAFTSGTFAVKRFESHVAFAAPTDLQNALQQVMFTCASDWQERGGKIGFLLPLPAVEVGEVATFDAGRRRVWHDFTEDNIVRGSIKAYQLDRRERWNRVKGHYRNVDDEFLTEDWVYDEREALRDTFGRTVDPGQVELGNMNKSQADRILKWHVRNKTDLTIFCELRGMGDSFHVLPGDVVRVTHSLYGWVDQLFLVIDATDESGESTADERVFVLHEYQQTYFDTDHGPLQSRVVGAPPTGLQAPPAPASLAVAEENRVARDGSVVTCIRGEVEFAPYAGRQRGRVWLKKPTDGDFVPTDITVIPDSTTGLAAFELTGLAEGAHRVKVVTESTFGVPGSELVATPDPITLTGRVVASSAPTNLTVETGDNGQRVYSCDEPADTDFSHMKVYDGAGEPVYGFTRLDATRWEEPPSLSTVTRKVTFFNRSQVESAFSNTVTYTPPVLPALEALAINRTGSDAAVVWTPGDNSSLPSHFVSAERKFLVEILNGSNVERAVTITIPKNETLRWTVRTDIGNPTLATVAADGTASTTGASLDNGWAESQEFTARDIAFVFEVDDRCPPWLFWLVPSAGPVACTADPATDTLSAPGHKLAENDPIEFQVVGGGSVPGGLSEGLIYFAVQVSGDFFKAAQFPSGSPVNLTGAGSSFNVVQETAGTYFETHISGGAPYLWAELAGFTSSSFTKRAVPGERYALVVENGHLSYVENYPGAPFYRSSWWAVPGAYKIRVGLGFLGGEAQAAVRCHAEAVGANVFVYTLGMQSQDFGSAQPSLTVRVREISDLAGAGPATTITG